MSKPDPTKESEETLQLSRLPTGESHHCCSKYPSGNGGKKKASHWLAVMCEPAVCVMFYSFKSKANDESLACFPFKIMYAEGGV